MCKWIEDDAQKDMKVKPNTDIYGTTRK